MQLGEWIGLGSLLITNVGSVLLTYNNFSKKINRIYERFDEYKKNIEKSIDDKFVQKDLCKVVHLNSSDNLNGLEERLNGRLSSLEKKTDDNFKVVIDLMKK